MLKYLDTQSRRHLRTFASQVAFLALFGLPVLLIDRHAPMLYLASLQRMFGLSAVVMLVLGICLRQAFSRTSLCIWDHFLAFVLLKFGCSLMLRMLG